MAIIGVQDSRCIAAVFVPDVDPAAISAMPDFREHRSDCVLRSRILPLLF
jgi:hypothetical protein